MESNKVAKCQQTCRSYCLESNVPAVLQASNEFSSFYDTATSSILSGAVAYPGILFGGGGFTNSVEDRENGDLGSVAPLVRGSEGSCNLLQEISFHIVKFS